MNKNEINKIILTYCPNFYRIINFEYYEDDHITEKLISIYEKFIFSVDIVDKEDIKTVASIDKVLARYIDDYQFRKEMKHELFAIKITGNTTNLLKTIVKCIINIFNRYEEGSTRRIYISRWI